MNFLTSLDDFPELSRGEAGSAAPNGLAADPVPDEPQTLSVIPPLAWSEIAETPATVEVTAIDEPDAPAPEVSPLFTDPVIVDQMPEPVALPPQEF